MYASVQSISQRLTRCQTMNFPTHRYSHAIHICRKMHKPTRRVGMRRGRAVRKLTRLPAVSQKNGKVKCRLPNIIRGAFA